MLVLGLPVLLGLIWWSGEPRSPGATADVSIDTSKVVELRTQVISRLAAIGATKTGETTAYADGGSSELTFRVPPARLEDALAELNIVGGVITRQQVELDELSEDASGVSSDLDDVGGCLSDIADRLANRTSGGATTDLDECQRRIDAMSEQLKASPQAAQDATLNVHISRASTTSVALIIAVVLLAIALAAMAYLTMRSARSDRIYDITDGRPARTTEDLYDRRN